jgi:Fe-S-cluster containining protein
VRVEATVRVLTRRKDPVAGRDPRTDSIASLHSDVDRESRRLHVLHAPRLQCRLGCSSCCVDGLTVFDVEADDIRRHYPELLAHGAPHAEGGCAFVGEGNDCRIYAHRPYVCRTQGLPLRWIEQEGNRDPVELRDICPLNEEGEPIETLLAEDCWTIGPTEERLGQLQLAGGGGARRTPLRDLFRV